MKPSVLKSSISPAWYEHWGSPHRSSPGPARPGLPVVMLPEPTGFTYWYTGVVGPALTIWKLPRTLEYKNMSKILFDIPKEVFNNVALRLNKYLWSTGHSYLLFIYFCARNTGHPLNQALSRSFLTHLEMSLYLLEMIIIPLASIEFHELKSSANPYHSY